MQQSFGLHGVERFRYVEATNAEFLCKSRHLYAQHLCAGRVEAVRLQEEHDATPCVSRHRTPQFALRFLCYCGDDVKKIDTENDKFVGDVHKVAQADLHRVAFANGRKRA